MQSALPGGCPAPPLLEFISPHVCKSPLRRDLVSPEPEVRDGVMGLPDRAGLGIEPEGDGVERYG